MNSSSGIKRGLAVSAISALAVAGLPLLASSATAAAGDSIAVGSVGPVLNAGDHGGVVVLKTKGIDPTKLALKGADLVSSPNNASQTVAIVGTPTLVADGAAGDSNKTDGLDEITMHISVTTPAAGSTAAFAVYEDENANTTVDAAEARSQVSMTTSGALSKIDITPASQSAAQGIESGKYNVTLLDSAGRTTQLMNANTIAVAGDNGFVPSDASLTATELELGTGSFTGHGPTVGTDNITLTANTTPAVVGKATLVVTKAASIQANEVDIVTGADSWDGFGGGTAGGTTLVRVDQNTIRIDFDGDAGDANSTVTLNVSSANVTFGGKGSTTGSTVLDANGVGSITITADAGSIQEGDTIDVSGSFAQTLEFERAAADAIVPDQDPFFSKVGGTVDVTATVVDQFGQPITTGYVTAARTGANAAADATPQKKNVGPDGKVTFSFTDTKATNGSTENVSLKHYADNFAVNPDVTDSATIKYTTDGMGANYTAYINGDSTEGATYDPSKETVVPLADANDDELGEDLSFGITGGEGNSAVTVSVDNGALLLPTGKTKLSDGKSSVTTTLAGGVLAGYNLVGTKSGLVTVTITSAGRTETAKFTVLGETDKSTARNVGVSGPAEVANGTTQIQYTAVVTDAFGNPVVGFPVNELNVQVTGPAQFQDADAVTDSAGKLHLNVRVDSGAEGDVSIRVQGLGEQFGAAADQLTSSSPANSAKGLPVSANVANATTTVASAPVGPHAISPNITGKHIDATDTVAGYDRIVVSAKTAGADAVVKLYRVKNGVAKRVKSKDLGADGKAIFKRADLNGDKNTFYYATVGATDTNLKGTTDTIGIR